MIDDEPEGDEPVPTKKLRPKLGQVTADAIRQAMNEISAAELVQYASTTWDVYDPEAPSRKYPPKRLLRNAIVLSGVGNWSFSGGRQTNVHLEAAGFPVVLKKNVKEDPAAFARWALAGASRTPRRMIRKVAVFERSRELSDWVKALAQRVCALCKCDAPFTTNDEPFLEAHHVKWLRDGGGDTFNNIVALCPNCHRRVHALNLATDVEALKHTVESRFKALSPKVQLLVRKYEER